MADEDDGVVLDYSATSDPAPVGTSETKVANEDIDFDTEAAGTRTGKGQFILKDLEDEVHSILAASSAKKTETTSSSSGVVGSSISAISGLFRNIVGGKVLTKEDLIKPMKGMEEHLVKKNVAQEAAVRLCEGVERELIGVKTGSFESMALKIAVGCAHRLTSFLPYRYRCSHPNSNGIFPTKDTHSYNLSRPPPKHNSCHLPINPKPALTRPSSLRNFHSWRQWRRQIHQPLQTSLLPPPE